MELFTSKKWWGYTGRFLLIHIVTYSIVAVVFSFVKDALPTSSRIALDFYKLYEPFNFLVLITQIIRGIIISFALYPFYNSIIKSSRGVLVLFGLLWGMVVVGSLEPLPGSIEGMIYTTTTLLEHLMVMIAGAIQALLFSWLFLCWEYKVGKIDLIRDRHEKRYKDYLTRFILLHVITYTLIGVLFYQLQDYKVAFEVQEYFKLFRPTDHPLVKYSVFIQILRGGILAVFLYPFYHIFMGREQGWILLFGLTVLGSMVFIPNFIIRLTEVSFIQVVLENIVGLPEIVVQILLFSWLYIKWEEKKTEQTNEKV